MIKHLNIAIRGRVQGVFFRSSAKNKANDLSINGFARNESDGSVHIEAEGEESDLAKFVDWCRIGPWLSKVESVDASEGELKNYKNFAIQ